MKNIKYYILVLSFFSLTLACKSSKLQSKLPFKLFESTYYHWTGGQAGVRGTNVVIKGLNKNLKNFVADSIYFNNRVAKIETHIKKDSIILMGYFTSARPVIKLELEPETKIKKQTTVIKNPYHLNKNEAVITYYYKGKKLYYKLIGLVETNKKYYP